MTRLLTQLSPSSSRIRTFLAICWGATLLFAPRLVTAQVAPAREAAAEKKPLGSTWVRLLEKKGEPIAMQTALIRYVPTPDSPQAGSRLRVDLIGAIHVADSSYYDDLNRRFRKYDALLYELVAPEGTVVERGRGTSNAHPVGALQNGMKRALALEHQLEEIDYTRPNFVHADMSPAQMSRSMQQRGESFLQMYFKLLGQAMSQQSRMQARGESLDANLFEILFSPDRPRMLKILMARQLASMESLLVSFGGEEGSTLIQERNKVALAVLKREIAAGKQSIGIFYGAGHLTDMDETLRDQFQLRPVEITWLTAWDLKPKK